MLESMLVRQHAVFNMFCPIEISPLHPRIRPSLSKKRRFVCFKSANADRCNTLATLSSWQRFQRVTTTTGSSCPVEWSLRYRVKWWSYRNPPVTARANQSSIIHSRNSGAGRPLLPSQHSSLHTLWWMQLVRVHRKRSRSRHETKSMECFA